MSLTATGLKDITAMAEFMNEPNMLAFSGVPGGYTSVDYVIPQHVLLSEHLKEMYGSSLENQKTDK